MAFKQLLAAVSVALLAQGVAVNKRVTCSTGQSVSNEACCAWFPVLEDIQQNMFNGGECNAEAHESLRLSVTTSACDLSALGLTGNCSQRLPRWYCHLARHGGTGQVWVC